MATDHVRTKRTGAITGEALRQDLTISGCRFAQRALRARSAGPPQLDRFFLYGGISLEHLAKAYLASIHPSLIAEGKSFDALLHACGRSDLAQTATMRTIGLVEAVERCAQLLRRELRNAKQELEILIASRNGVAHLGQVAELESATRVLLPYLKALTSLGSALGLSSRKLWGRHADYVATRLSSNATKIQYEVAEAINRAKTTFYDRFGRFTPSERSAFLDVLLASEPRTSTGLAKYNEALLPCPACGTDVVVYGGYDLDWETDFDIADDEAYAAGAHPIVTFLPFELDCRACGLALEGPEELEAVGIRQLEREDIDPADFPVTEGLGYEDIE